MSIVSNEKYWRTTFRISVLIERSISLFVFITLRCPLYRVRTRPETLCRSWPVCFGNRPWPEYNIRIFMIWITHLSSCLHGVHDIHVIAEFPFMVSSDPTLSMVHLPQANSPECGLLIHLPSIVMLPMNSTVRLIGHHSDNCMVKKHFPLLRIPCVPIMRWLVYARIMWYTVRRYIKVRRPSLEVPFSPDDEESIFRNIT